MQFLRPALEQLKVVPAAALAGLPNAMRMWNLDAQRLEASDEKGRSMKLRPFMGVMGVAPPEPGE